MPVNLVAYAERVAGARYIGGLRQRRYEWFLALCSVAPTDTILDVGAGAGLALERFNTENPIVALDPNPERSSYLAQDNVTVVTGDARRLDYPDRGFSICFSNSVLQYMVGEERKTFADEIRRVCDRYFVQAPYRYFPIEPHYMVPFFQLLPVPAQRWLNKRVGLGWRRKGSWTETRLPTVREMRQLFPDATIKRERVFGLTKSLIAYRSS